MKSASVFIFLASLITTAAHATDLLNKMSAGKEQGWFKEVSEEFENAVSADESDWKSLNYARVYCVEKILESKDTGRVEYQDSGTRYRVMKTKIYETVPTFVTQTGIIDISKSGANASFKRDDAVNEVSGASFLKGENQWQTEVSFTNDNELKALVNVPYSAHWGATSPNYNHWEFTMRRVDGELVLRQNCQDKKSAWCPSGRHPTAVSGFNFAKPGETVRFCVVKSSL